MSACLWDFWVQCWYIQRDLSQTLGFRLSEETKSEANVGIAKQALPNNNGNAWQRDTGVNTSQLTQPSSLGSLQRSLKDSERFVRLLDSIDISVDVSVDIFVRFSLNLSLTTGPASGLAIPLIVNDDSNTEKSSTGTGNSG